MMVSHRAIHLRSCTATGDYLPWISLAYIIIHVRIKAIWDYVVGVSSI